MFSTLRKSEYMHQRNHECIRAHSLTKLYATHKAIRHTQSHTWSMKSYFILTRSTRAPVGNLDALLDKVESLREDGPKLRVVRK